MTSLSRDVYDFQGACLDTSAQQSVIVIRRALAYYKQHNVRYTLKPSLTKFKFGDGVFSLVGTIQIRIPTLSYSFFKIKVNVIPADVPLLLGLDVSDNEELVANNVQNELQGTHYGWSMSLTRNHGHLYLTCNSKSILFTKSEIIKLHRHFKHPMFGKLYEVMKRARPSQVNEATRKLLETITKACETCQMFSAPPQRFRVSLPPFDIVFNREVALDLMWVEREAVLHVVDIEAEFNSATFLSYQTVEAVWGAFVICWASLYIGFPMKMRVDQGSPFTLVRWTNRAKAVGTDAQESGVEAYNSLESGEGYHAPLRRIFLKIREEHPKMDKNIILKVAVKAMNDTMGLEGLVPSYLVFRCIPRVLPTESALPTQQQRMDAMQSARREIAIILKNFEFEKLSYHAFQETPIS